MYSYLLHFTWQEIHISFSKRRTETVWILYEKAPEDVSSCSDAGCQTSDIMTNCEFLIHGGQIQQRDIFYSNAEESSKSSRNQVEQFKRWFVLTVVQANTAACNHIACQESVIKEERRYKSLTKGLKRELLFRPIIIFYWQWSPAQCLPPGLRATQDSCDWFKEILTSRISFFH